LARGIALLGIEVIPVLLGLIKRGIAKYNNKEIKIGDFVNEKPFKFSDMQEKEIDKIVEQYRKKAPIKIPNTAKYRAKSMEGGYEQIAYKWSDETYKYEARWQTWSVYYC